MASLSGGALIIASGLACMPQRLGIESHRSFCMMAASLPEEEAKRDWVAKSFDVTMGAAAASTLDEPTRRKMESDVVPEASPPVDSPSERTIDTAFASRIAAEAAQTFMTVQITHLCESRGCLCAASASVLELYEKAEKLLCLGDQTLTLSIKGRPLRRSKDHTLLSTGVVSFKRGKAISENVLATTSAPAKRRKPAGGRPPGSGAAGSGTAGSGAAGSSPLLGSLAGGRRPSSGTPAGGNLPTHDPPTHDRGGAEVASLRAEVALLRAELLGASPASSDATAEVVSLRAEVALLRSELEQLHSTVETMHTSIAAFMPTSHGTFDESYPGCTG